jgi:hypothetical protein
MRTAKTRILICSDRQYSQWFRSYRDRRARLDFGVFWAERGCRTAIWRQLNRPIDPSLGLARRFWRSRSPMVVLRGFMMLPTHSARIRSEIGRQMHRLHRRQVTPSLTQLRHEIHRPVHDQNSSRPPQYTPLFGGCISEMKGKSRATGAKSTLGSDLLDVRTVQMMLAGWTTDRFWPDVHTKTALFIRLDTSMLTVTHTETVTLVRLEDTKTVECVVQTAAPMKLTMIAFRTRPTRRQLPLSRPPSHLPMRISSLMCVSRETCPDARNQAVETAKPGEKHPDRQQHTPTPGLSRGETRGPRAQQAAQTPRRPSKGHRLLIPCAMRGLSSNELLGEAHRVGLQAHVAVHHHTTPPQHVTERTHSLQHAL